MHKGGAIDLKIEFSANFKKPPKKEGNGEPGVLSLAVNDDNKQLTINLTAVDQLVIQSEGAKNDGRKAEKSWKVTQNGATSYMRSSGKSM
eukprot:8001523-Ditylum_brightwellii.AAC.1